MAVLFSDRADRAGLGIALVVAILYFSLRSEHFLSVANFQNIGQAVAVPGMIAAVATIVLVSGGLDLSVSASIGMGGVVAGEVLVSGGSIALALVLALGAGVCVGLGNALLIVGVGVNALIATIGTQFTVRGLMYIWTDMLPISLYKYSDFTGIGTSKVLGIGTPVVILVAVFVLVGVTMRLTRYGERIYVVGGNERAAVLAGIPVTRVKTLAYAASGLVAAGAGVVLAATNGAAYPDAGIGSELTILAAVILGGTALAGGRGSVIGTVLGVLLLGVLANGLNLIGVKPYVQTLVQGVALVVAISFDGIRERWVNR